MRECGPADFTGGPGDHRAFTGTDLQDVLAYYPAGINAGMAVIGNGSTLALSDPLNDTVRPRRAPRHPTRLPRP